MVMELLAVGSTQSPTVSQLGRMLSCQMIVGDGWNLQLGDNRGAFLEADALDRKQRSLCSSLPSGGISGVPDGAVILILGNIYGLNDALQRWWMKFDAVMTSIGFIRSTFDVCVSLLSEVLLETWRESCVFMWTTQFCGGSGSLFSKALTALRHRFPFRKWQVGEGMFCGSKCVQNKDTKEVVISQTEFAVKITEVHMSPARKKMREDPADKAEIHALRGVSGSISWLAGQTRPDVSCQVSQLQQTLPQPTVAQVCASHQHAE